MIAAAPAASLAASAPPVRLSRSAVAVAGVVALAVAARIVVGAGTPLWFDETFSVVIAAQPSAAAMVDWCRSEIGGPVYYVLLWLWAQAFGTGAVALRSLSFVASVAAPAWVAWRGHPDRSTRLVWAALMALWLPALDPATNARPYALATLMATAQAISYWRVMAVPTRARALAWTGASVLAILTHNHCAAIAVVGGVIFLAVHRRRALACWPALAPLAPMALWLAYQFPVLAKFAGQGAWYPPFDPLDLLLAPANLFGSVLLGAVLTVGPIVTHAKGWRGDAGTPDRALAASGLIAFALVLVLATLRPSFTWRYASPYGPSLLFGVAIWARGLQTRLAAAPAILVALFAASAIGRIAQVASGQDEDYRTGFTLELPSDWLAAHGARHLAFLWDSPTGAMSDPRRIGEVSAYFLRGHGPATVTVLRAPGATPPAPLVAEAIRRDASIDSLIWIADETVPGTHGTPDRRMMARLGWTCRDYGRGTIHMLTCRAGR